MHIWLIHTYHMSLRQNASLCIRKTSTSPQWHVFTEYICCGIVLWSIEISSCVVCDKIVYLGAAEQLRFWNSHKLHLTLVWRNTAIKFHTCVRHYRHLTVYSLYLLGISINKCYRQTFDCVTVSTSNVHTYVAIPSWFQSVSDPRITLNSPSSVHSIWERKTWAGRGESGESWAKETLGLEVSWA